MNGAAFSSETYEHDHEPDSCRLIFHTRDSPSREVYIGTVLGRPDAPGA
jgi:hypothetical protein